MLLFLLIYMSMMQQHTIFVQSGLWKSKQRQTDQEKGIQTYTHI